MMEDGVAGPAPQYPIESVDNALKVLLLLGEREELRLTEVSRYLGVASSTAHRILPMLQYRGFVRQDGQGGAYRPGAALTSVAFAILQRFDFRGRAGSLPGTAERRDERDRPLGNTRRRDYPVHRRHREPAAGTGRVPARPLHACHRHVIGKAILAELATEDLHARYPRQELETLTEHSVRTRDELERQLDGVRRRGYAMSIEESQPGVSSVAMAIPARATPARRAFNVSAPLNRMTPSARKTIGQILIAVAKEAATVLHG